MKGHGTTADAREAIKWFELAIAQNFPGAMNNLAWVLATHSDDSVRDGAKAVSLAERSVAMTDRKIPWNLGTLAASYAEIGEFDKAARTQREAIALLEKETEDEKKDFRMRLTLYESKMPFRMKE